MIPLLWKMFRQKRISKCHFRVYTGFKVCLHPICYVCEGDSPVTTNLFFSSNIWHHGFQRNEGLMLFTKYEALNFWNKTWFHAIAEMSSLQRSYRLWQLKERNSLVKCRIAIRDVRIEYSRLVAPEQGCFALIFPIIKFSLSTVLHLNNNAFHYCVQSLKIFTTNSVTPEQWCFS